VGRRVEVRSVPKGLWAVVPLLAAVAFYALVYSNRAARCVEGGLSRAVALKIAEEEVRLEFGISQPVLKEERFDDEDKGWRFTLIREDCQVSLLIDRCERTEWLGHNLECRSGEVP
jgi:hypothetical protein